MPNINKTSKNDTDKTEILNVKNEKQETKKIVDIERFSLKIGEYYTKEGADILLSAVRSYGVFGFVVNEKFINNETKYFVETAEKHPKKELEVIIKKINPLVNQEIIMA